MEKNQFRLADVILSVICVVFVAEAAAPVASIGNSQYFWWIFMILAFLLPYGLIAAELGTAYAGDGGLYDWIHAAYPDGKWAARASWYYWINFPLWMASLAVMCPELITFITGRSLGTFGSLVVELLFIWIVTLIACYPVCDSIIILNVSAVIKIVLALLVGGLGVWYISRYGFVNDMSARTFLPSFDLNSLSYISVIIFNFLGFEVVCTYANNMSDPKKQIPQSIVTGGIVIAAIYLFSAFGIGAAVDVHEISVDSGLIDAVSLILGGSGGVLVGVSLGWLLREEATTGGTELGAWLLKAKIPGLSIGTLCLAIDLTIIVFYAAVFRSLENALYGGIALYISTKVMDMVVYGGSAAKLAYIISNEQEKITHELLARDMGVTRLTAEGAYTHNDKPVLLCAVRRREIVAVKRLVNEIDPTAFFIVCDAREVLGEGFGEYKPDGL